MKKLGICLVGAIFILGGCAGVVQQQPKKVDIKFVQKKADIKPMPKETIIKKQKCIALTFDDGPHATYTPKILNLLEAYNARATFFILGQRVRGNEVIVQRIIKGGNEVGNHTWDHPKLTTLPSAKIKKEVIDSQKIILASASYNAKLFRPPYGAFNSFTKKTVEMPFVLWTVDTLDWRDRNAEIVARRVLKEAKDGAVILMHDIHPSTVEAVKIVIPKLKEAGFIFVTVSELKKL